MTPNMGYRSDDPYTHDLSSPHSSDLLLTPPYSDPPRKSCTEDVPAFQLSDPPKFNAMEAYNQLVELQQREFVMLNSQRSIDRQSIARLEAQRDLLEDFQKQREKSRQNIINAWSKAIAEVFRLERRVEEVESDHVEFERHLQDLQLREHALHKRNEELQLTVMKLDGEARTFWTTMGSMIAALVIVVSLLASW